MPIKAKKKILFVKNETTYGVDAVPVAATDAKLVHNFSCTPLEGVYEERDPALPFFGNMGQVKVGEFMRMEYEIEATGAGGVATVPGFGVQLRGCALAEVITPTVGPVTYSPITSGEESETKYFYWDGLLHKMLGAMATAELRISNGKRAMIHTAWMGLYGGITDVAMPVPVLTAFQKALGVNKANTTFSIHGFTGVLTALTLTQGNNLVYRNAPNVEKINFTGRKSKGSLTIELPTIAVKDFFAIIRAEPPTLGALTVTHGTAAGNKFIVNAANVRLLQPKYSEADDIAMLSMDMDIQPSATGNDEWSFATQ